MPNIWTHNLFGDTVVKLDDRRQWLSDRGLTQLFHLGCQGPDFLFYHRFLPWQGKSAMNELGSEMHQQACGPALMMMAETAAALRAKPDDPLTVYIMGFMMHHVLDRNMHPYVFTKSGSKQWDHQRFEVILDTLVVRRMLGIATWANPAWRTIHIGEAIPSDVVDMMHRIAETHYPELYGRIVKREWNEAYRDMIRAQKIFHDPYGIKRVLTFGKIEPLVYKRRTPDRDFLNVAHTRWRHPAVEQESSTQSFDDLWEQSLADARLVWDAAFAYWADPNDNTYATLENVIGNRSYEHGKPVAEGLTIRFEEPIW